MSKLTFIFDIMLLIILSCSSTLNVAAYFKTKNIIELETSLLMIIYCLNSITVFMSEFLHKQPLFVQAYQVLNYFAVKAICGITISALYLSLTLLFLEKKCDIYHIIVMMPLICITVYIGYLNNSVMQHWLFYTIRQIYLAGFVIYYFINYVNSKDQEYQMRIRKYLFPVILGGLFAVLIFLEDSIVIFNFQYIINILNLKVFIEHNLSEDILFILFAVIGIINGYKHLLQRTDPTDEVQLEKDEPFIIIYGLTNRQRDVLMLLIEDLTYREMGEKLGLSVGTIKSHVHIIYEKTDCRNKSELINKYREFYEYRE